MGACLHNFWVQYTSLENWKKQHFAATYQADPWLKSNRPWDNLFCPIKSSVSSFLYANVYTKDEQLGCVTPNKDILGKM